MPSIEKEKGANYYTLITCLIFSLTFSPRVDKWFITEFKSLKSFGVGFSQEWVVPRYLNYSSVYSKIWNPLQWVFIRMGCLTSRCQGIPAEVEKLSVFWDFYSVRSKGQRRSLRTCRILNQWHFGRGTERKVKKKKDSSILDMEVCIIKWNWQVWRFDWLFIQWFMPGSIPSSKQRGTLKSCPKWKGFMDWRVKKKEVSKKKWFVSGRVTFPWGKVRIYKADDLTSAEQVSPDWLFKLHSWGIWNCSEVKY